MAVTKPDENFHSLGGISVHSNDSQRYREYRRCWKEYPTEHVVRDFPMHLDVEITNRCNLRCTFCDKLPLLKPHQMGDMDFGLFKKILDEGEEHGLWGLKLSYRGEPMLHRKIAAMVGYANKRGVLDIYFNTNGMLLSEYKAKELIDAGLTRISVSIEGTDAAVFERERKGAKLETIVRNVDRLINIRDRGGYLYPKVRIQTVLFPDLDVTAYRDHWASHCDEVAAVDYKDVSVRRTCYIRRDWACPQLWQRMTIEWDGTVMPCNNDDTRSLSPGNVKTKTVMNCWHDPLVKRARELHEKGLSHTLEACDGCPWRTAQIEKI